MSFIQFVPEFRDTAMVMSLKSAVLVCHRSYSLLCLYCYYVC